MRSLRIRIAELLDFGAGRPVAHYGGRYLWQVEGSERFLVAWRADVDPTRSENRLLRVFSERFGSYPYANIAGPRG